MKILRVFGVVVGIHLFALMFIFANPGCSSTSKPAPQAAETAAVPASASPVISVPLGGEASTLTAAPLFFDPSAPAVSGVRYTPTRPGTPAASALSVAPVTDVLPAAAYTVAKGDSLWTIAKKNRLTVSELAAANNLKPASTLRLGQKLIVPGKVSGDPKAPATMMPAPEKTAGPVVGPVAKPSTEAVSHTVKMGESLGTIARKYGVKQGEIAVANNITDPQKITAGQVLVIPGWQTPVSKSKPGAKPVDAGGKPSETPRPLFVLPPIDQDLDSGLRPAQSADVPVIKIEEAPALVPKPL